MIFNSLKQTRTLWYIQIDPFALDFLLMKERKKNERASWFGIRSTIVIIGMDMSLVPCHWLYCWDEIVRKIKRRRVSPTNKRAVVYAARKLVQLYTCANDNSSSGNAILLRTERESVCVEKKGRWRKWWELSNDQSVVKMITFVEMYM